MLIVQLLLKLFFPSWNFFDRFESYFELEFFDQHKWQKVDFFSGRSLSAVLFNPKGNYELFLRTQLDRFADRLTAFKNAPELETIRQLSSYRILQAYLSSDLLARDRKSAVGDLKYSGRNGESPSKTDMVAYFPMRIFQCRGQQERKLVIEIAGGT